MAAGHLVADADLTLLGHIHLGHLHDARRQLVADRDVEFLAAQLSVDLLRLAQIVDDRRADQVVAVGIGCPFAQIDRIVVYVAQTGSCELVALRYDFRAEEILHTLRGLAVGKLHELAHKQILQLGLLALILFVEFGQLGVGALGATLLGGTAEQVGADHHTLQRRSGLQRSILHIAGLLAEYGAEQLLLGSGIALALGGDLTDHDVARADMRAHADDTALVEILRGILADIGNIRGQFLHTALCLAHFERELVDMDRSQ